MDLGIKNKTALVVAASQGIGKAAAIELIKEGCNVAICSSNKQNLIEAAGDIKIQTGIEPFWIVCDINKLSDINNVVENVKNKFGTIDILVNNCGGPKPGYFDELNSTNWDDAYNQVLMSTVQFTKLVLPEMKKNKWGRIINVTSLSVKQPVDNLILSNSFRSAVTAFAKTISQQYGEFGITVNNIAPGFILTSRLYELAVKRAEKENVSQKEILARMAKSNPVKRLGTPEEMGATIAFLASDRAGYITGVTLQVDGGQIKSTY
ncbi:MAG: SDR family oxidoreductase [Melioribacteraceae bacterium]|nr:SDR family oxidoreductase [Melioribacteraceae bacterium]